MISEAKRRTIAELIDRYVREVIPQKKHSSQGTQKAQLLWWKAQIGAYLLCNVTPALLGECRDRLAFVDADRKVARSPSTVVRYLAVLSHAFTMAVNLRHALPAVPRGTMRWQVGQRRLAAIEIAAMPQKARPAATYAGASRSSRPMGACGAAVLHFAAS